MILVDTVLSKLRIEPLPTTGPTIQEEVLAWLIKDAEHQPDWADGCLAVLSGRDSTLKVWIYDREFRATWRRPNGTAVPLAVRV